MSEQTSGEIPSPASTPESEKLHASEELRKFLEGEKPGSAKIRAAANYGALLLATANEGLAKSDEERSLHRIEQVIIKNDIRKEEYGVDANAYDGAKSDVWRTVGAYYKGLGHTTPVDFMTPRIHRQNYAEVGEAAGNFLNDLKLLLPQETPK